MVIENGDRFAPPGLPTESNFRVSLRVLQICVCLDLEEGGVIARLGIGME